MARERLQRPRTPRRSQRIKPFCDRASVPATDRQHTAVPQRHFALKKRTRTEPVPPKSGSPADSSGHKSENVNDGKQRLRRTAAAAATAQGLEKTVNGPSSATNTTTGNRRNKSVSAVKDWKKAQKPSSPNYFINTRSTRRSEIVISYSNSASSYYNQLCNEDLVIPTKPTVRITNNSRKSNKSGSNNNKLTERYKKVARRTSKRLSRSSASTRKRVLFENILAYEYKDTVENSTSEEEAEVEEEAEQVVPLVPRKSFFESSVEDFCQLHPAFEKATERCLNRLRLVRSAFPMNSPASPATPAPTMTAVSSTAIYQSHLSPNTAALIAQSQQLTTHSGKRKHPEDTYTIPTNDHNYPQVQSTTPPGHNTQQHPNKQLVHPNSSNQTNHFRLSPRSWIYQTPDKQKLGKLPPPSTIRDEDDETLTVPVMIHHNKRLKTVYSFDESTVADIVGAGGGGSEVQIDSDRLAPICQITTADDGADCEFETNNSIDDDVTLTSNSTNGTSTTIGRCEEQNQFQVQTHELSLDFGTSTVVGKQQRLVGGGGDGEVAFLDQWVMMNTGGSGSGSSSGDHSPLRLLQTNQHRIPQTMVPSRYFAQPPLAQAHVNHHLRNIHNVATQRPTKSLPRCDRRQYLERKSLTFEEMNSGTSADTPKANGIRAMISGKLRALKQKAASADSISDGGVTGSGGGRKSMNLFHVGRGEIMRDLRDIAETVTSGAYERELSNEQENILPPSHMGLLLGNLQMNDSVDIRYDRPLFPRRNY